MTITSIILCSIFFTIKVGKEKNKHITQRLGDRWSRSTDESLLSQNTPLQWVDFRRKTSPWTKMIVKTGYNFKNPTQKTGGWWSKLVLNTFIGGTYIEHPEPSLTNWKKQLSQAYKTYMSSPTWNNWETPTVDGSEIRRSPVELGSLSHYLRSVLYIPGGDRQIAEPSTGFFSQVNFFS